MKFPLIGQLVRPMTGILAGVAALLVSSGSQASDPYGWRGFYVGAAGAYSTIKQDITFTAPTAVSGSADLNGVGFTGLVGYRIPLGSNRVRVGVEFDGTIGDNGGSFNQYRFVSDFVVTARGMIGIHVHPGLLWFATGGVGWMGINSSPMGSAPGLLGAALIDRRSSKVVMGGVVGTGFEWDLGKAIHLRGDYLYGAFENHRADTAAADKTISTDMHQLRLGLTFSLQNPYDEPHGRGDDIDHDRYSRRPLK